VNKKFFKFTFGFLAIIILAILIMYFVAGM